MISIRNIASVAIYERKTLFRSWFFKIFSILTLFILFLLNIGFFAEPDARWTPRAIPANIPYINVLFVNVAQAIIAVFLASDFIRRDKKLDTTEVIYARPISNGEYVSGKTLGIMTLFIGLVYVVLLMGLIINLILKDSPVVWEAYLLYPLLISIPTLTFILGLSFFLMILFKNQAVTFIILLGYIGLTLFYFKDKLHGLLDYIAFNIPMVYSDFIQFADLNNILLQRMAYMLLGLGFIFATIRFLGRLPQTGKWNFINLAAFLLLVSFGLLSGYKYYSGFRAIEKDREEFIRLNNLYAGMPIPDIQSNRIILAQKGRKLTISSEVNLRNQNNNSLDTLIFTLNPGFSIDSISSRDGAVEFMREHQLVRIIPEVALAPGRRATYTFYYKGIPEEDLAYLDIPKKELAKLKRIQLATLDKKAAIINENYILLTGELFWYPEAGVGFNTHTYQEKQLDFVRFNLSVRPEKGLTAISSGRMEEKDDAVVFSQDNDLNTLPLVIGPFEKKSISIDNVDYNLFFKPDHDYFSQYFPTISDTLSSLITEAKEDYEYDELDLYYSFKRINLVEVPIQFHAYERPYKQLVDYIQPEIIFIPEKGAGLTTLDFKRNKRGEVERNKDRDNTKTDKEIEIDLFKNFIENTFFRAELNDGRGLRRFRSSLIDYSGDVFSRNPFCAFPLYFNYVSGINSKDYPVFNSMIEVYLKNGFEVSPRDGFIGGITDSERANLALKEESLVDIFATENTELISSTVYQAGSFIITALKNRVGIKEFDNFLYYYLEDHAFSEISFEGFARDFKSDFDVDIEPYLDFIKSGSEMPEYLFSEPEFFQTRDDYGDVYIVRLKISNIGGSSGLIDLTFRLPGQGGFGGGGGGGGMSTEQRLFEIEAKQTKELQLVFYDQPRMMTINTLVSGNIPSSFNVFLRSATEKNISNLEEYQKILPEALDMSEDGEIIVDNEDPGFSYISVSNESKIKKYIDSRKTKSEEMDYKTLNQYWRFSEWTAIVHSAMYGETIRSAYVAREGNGSNIATWSTRMPSAGFYDIYVYIPVGAMYKAPSGRNRGDESQRGGREGRRGPEFLDKGTEYNYVIRSNEGSEDLKFTLNAPENGWNRLGTFHFPSDSAFISLSNNTNGTRVIADAVKWVARD